LKKFRTWLEKLSFYKNFEQTAPLFENFELKNTTYKIHSDKILTLKLAVYQSIPDLILIQKKCYNGTVPWQKGPLVREIELNDNALYFIAYDKEKPVAFIGSWFLGDEAHITNLATIPEYQNLGVGTFLMEEIIQLAGAYTFSHVTLEVRVSNHPAQSLYRKLGFTDGSVKKNYYSVDNEDALNMILLLKKDFTI